MPDYLISHAEISQDKQYRYWLKRQWAKEGRTMLWIMLNPSTADSTHDDPTIRRCVSFAKRDGFGGIVVCNLFALRSPDPNVLVDHPDPIGLHNTTTLDFWIVQADTIVCAWGAKFGDSSLLGAGLKRSRPAVESMASKHHRDLWCLGLTKKGFPRHPLYISAKQPLVLYREAK